MKWSDEEDEVLRKLWVHPEISREDLLKVFSSRTWHSIDGKRKGLRLESFQSYRKPQMNLEYYRELIRVHEIE